MRSTLSPSKHFSILLLLIDPACSLTVQVRKKIVVQAMVEVVSPGYYVETMQGLLSDMRVLGELIKVNLPVIAAHMGTYVPRRPARERRCNGTRGTDLNAFGRFDVPTFREIHRSSEYLLALCSVVRLVFLQRKLASPWTFSRQSL